MAKGGRKYARDARGRFASTGATARGGRLGKASGKRATVTAKAKGGSKGTISKPAGLQPGAIKPKPQASPAAKASAPKATNKVAASPRRLNKDERVYAEVMSNPKLRSDKARRAEMQRLGVDPKNSFALRKSVMAKLGQPGESTTDVAEKIRLQRDAYRNAIGQRKPSRRR